MTAAVGEPPGPDRRHPYDRRPPAWRFVWRTATAVIAGLLLAWLGERLLPSAEAAKRLLANAYLPWATAADDAPLLRWLPRSARDRLGYDSTGQKSVTVVLLGDQDLKPLGDQWPPLLDTYALVIDKLREFGAGAIFLDLLLIDERADDDVLSLRAAACRARAAGVPVLLASLGGGSPKGKTEALLLQPQPVNGEQQPCIERVAPYTAHDKFDRSAWEYPLCGRSLPSAAYGLACAHERLRGQVCALDRSIRCPAAPDDSRSLEELLATPHPAEDEGAELMAITWAAKGSAHNSDLLLEPVPGSQALRRTCETRLSALRYLLPMSLAVPEDLPEWAKPLGPEAVSALLPAPTLPLCPYTDIVPARALFDFKAQGASTPEASGLAGQGRRHLIDKRIVLIGASFIGHSDRQFTPLGRQLEGVHIHAMALDNLLTLGEGWRRVGTFKIDDWHAPGTLFALVSVMLIVLAWEAQHVLNRWARRREQKLRRPSSDRWFRPMWRGMPRTLLFIKNLALTIVSLGQLPSRRRGHLSGWALVAYWAMWMVLWSATMLLIFTLANDGFHVGPLSQLEYVLAPAALGFVDHGHRLARALVLLWDATRSARPAQTIRAYRGMPASDEDDDTPEHVKRDSTFTLPAPDDFAADPRGPAPARRRTPPE